MAKLTPEMKNMILTRQCFHATVSKDGMPKPKAVILVHIEEIHSLKPGPMAGKRIG